MKSALQRYLVPGLVIQSVIVGGTYATGREVTEFFLSIGHFQGMIGLLLATSFYSLICIIAFELARRYQIFDYKSFCEVYLGRFWVLYEIGFLCGVMLTLSIIAAASAEMAYDLVGLPKLVSSILFMAVIGLLVYIGTEKLEAFMSVWSIFFYSAYGVLLIFVISQYGGELFAKLQPEPLALDSLMSALIYTGFSAAILPTLIFVAHNLTSRGDALIAGSLCGPLVLLPGFAIFLMLLPYHPEVNEVPVPIMTVLNDMEVPYLATVIKIAILGTFATTGAGLLHGLNERIAKTMADRQQQKMSKALRPAVALMFMIFSVYLASAVGIIELVATGFRYSAIAFITLIFLPLLTRGLWMILPRTAVRDAELSVKAASGRPPGEGDT